MKMYFPTRSVARNFKSKSVNAVSVNSTALNKPSPSGSKWAVKLKPRSK